MKILIIGMMAAVVVLAHGAAAAVPKQAPARAGTVLVRDGLLTLDRSEERRVGKECRL